MNTATVKEKYLSFEGRLNRKTFIIRKLWILLAAIVLALPPIICLEHMKYTGIEAYIYDSYIYYSNIYYYYLYPLIFLWPIISLNMRRFHDLNKSAWWITLLFIPVISFFFIIYLFFFKGTIGPNHFGEDPLATKESTHFPLR